MHWQNPVPYFDEYEIDLRAQSAVIAFFYACNLLWWVCMGGFVPTGSTRKSSSGSSTYVHPSPIFDDMRDGFILNKTGRRSCIQK